MSLCTAFSNCYLQYIYAATAGARELLLEWCISPDELASLFPLTRLNVRQWVTFLVDGGGGVRFSYTAFGLAV